jgi:ligand-binding sensor domain-containing protein
LNQKAKQYIILLLIAFRWAIGSGTNSGSYTYEYYNSSHGLASSEIIALAKDSEGFLWIGTAAGLSRYDGYEFQNYSRSKDN